MSNDGGYLSNWSTFRPVEEQARYWYSDARFNVVAAGRRSGKTEMLKRKVILRALEGTEFPDPQFFIACPTRPQVKRIYWKSMLDLTRTVRTDQSASDLWIRLLNGATIHLLGMDTPARIEGAPWDGGGLDEYGNMRSTVWGQHVRPALSDRLGWCDFIGVPEGRNHYWDLWQKAVGKNDWARFSWHSSKVLPEHEIQAAMEDMDELEFRQEYEAEFISFGGLVYHAYDPDKHLKPLPYSDTGELVFCFDFNVEPGPAVICQEQQLPNGEYGTAVIGDVCISRNSTTERVCRKLIEQWGRHKGSVVCFGDATGGARGTKAVRGSDWDIVRNVLGDHFKQRVTIRVGKENPSEKARVNSLNARLHNAAGQTRMQIDPGRAPNLVRDLEGVQWVKGGAMEIDKHINPKLTHLSDALSYYIHSRYPSGGVGIKYAQVKQNAG